MHSILDRIRKEPALVTGAVSALIALGVAFGLNLTGEQTGASMAVARSQVAPNPTTRAPAPRTTTTLTSRTTDRSRLVTA